MTIIQAKPRGKRFFKYSKLITADTVGYNICLDAINNGWDGSRPLAAKVTINNGVKVGQSSFVNSDANFNFNTNISDLLGQSVTNNGVTISNSTYKIGKGSAYFNGSSSFTIPALQLGSYFTAEAWIYPLSLPAAGQYACIMEIGSFPNSVLIRLSSDPAQGVYVYGQNFYDIGTAWSGITANAWHHVAVVRQSNYCRFFLDGVKLGSDLYVSPIISGTLRVGAENHNIPANQYFNGYIDSLVICGEARWYTSFTPSTTHFYNQYAKSNVSAFTTGMPPVGSVLELVNNGSILGKGGNGGGAGITVRNSSAHTYPSTVYIPENGSSGGDAFLASYPIKVTNNGTIGSGGGGGGGGGAN